MQRFKLIKTLLQNVLGMYFKLTYKRQKFIQLKALGRQSHCILTMSQVLFVKSEYTYLQFC